MRVKIKVGDKEPKEVTPENHELFNKAEEIMTVLLADNKQAPFMGMQELGNLIDYIEETYGLEKKEK